MTLANNRLKKALESDEPIGLKQIGASFRFLDLESRLAFLELKSYLKRQELLLERISAIQNPALDRYNYIKHVVYKLAPHYLTCSQDSDFLKSLALALRYSLGLEKPFLIVIRGQNIPPGLKNSLSALSSAEQCNSWQRDPRFSDFERVFVEFAKKIQAKQPVVSNFSSLSLEQMLQVHRFSLESEIPYIILESEILLGRAFFTEEEYSLNRIVIDDSMSAAETALFALKALSNSWHREFA